jgi:CTP synthase (UTP-ammonia lyase)
MLIQEQNPYEHGECYVTDDVETDLDLLRSFLNVPTSQANKLQEDISFGY